MSKECRNDCVKPPRFPGDIQNRPGLAHIDYRIGTYADFRQALIHRLNQDPVLARWTHRQSDDPGIALLEGTAILGDILTFYQELYANEAYLGTAQWRESITDLVRLTGYRLSPGLAGKAAFAVEVKGDKPVTLPKGFRFKAQLEDMDKPAEFESATEVVAFPELSSFKLYRPLIDPREQTDAMEFYVDIAGLEQEIILQPDDRLFLGRLSRDGSNPLLWTDTEIAVVDSVRDMHGVQIFKIRGSLHKLSHYGEMSAFKIFRTFNHFGHNAPPQKMILRGRRNPKMIPEEVKFYREILNKPEDVIPDLKEGELPLDQELDDLSIGSVLILHGQLDAYVENQGFNASAVIITAEDVQKGSYTWGAMTGSVTLITIKRETAYWELILGYRGYDIRKIRIHETQGPKSVVKPAPKETTDDKGTTLLFYGSEEAAQALSNRRIVIQNVEGQIIKREVTKIEASRDNTFSGYSNAWQVNLDEEVDYKLFPHDNNETTIFGNLVVDATQGKTEAEAVLGSGDRRQVFQTFKLPKKPLTYFRSEEEDPPETPELKVYVNDRLWQRVPTFFDRGPNEQVYIVRQDEAGDSWVQFGDGKTGARLPSGLDNVTAVYRTGTGATGPIKEGATAQAGKRLEGLRKVHLPGEAFGGADRESGENAKAAAPGKLQSLGRLVTLQDIEYEARALPGVVKAAARWDIHAGGAAVVVTLLTQNGPTLTERRELEAILNQAYQDRGSRRFPIVVRRGVLHYIYLTVSIGYDATYKQALVKEAVKAALGVSGEEEDAIDGARGLFGVKHRCFGQPEYATRIEGTLQQVTGVVWAKVVAVGFLWGSTQNPSRMRRRSPLGSNAVFVSDARRPSHQPSQVLLALHTSHFTPKLIQVEPTEMGCHG